MDTFLTFLSDHLLLFAGVIGSIFLAAFFAASETAMLFANKTKLRQLADAGNARAEAALTLALERDRLHSALLLVENFVWCDTLRYFQPSRRDGNVCGPLRLRSTRSV